jgi:hypothetical protein
MAAAEAADRWMAAHWKELAPERVGFLATRAFDLLRGMVQPPTGMGR